MLLGRNNAPFYHSTISLNSSPSITFEIRTFLSPDISQLVKFAGSDNFQFVDFRAGHFSVTCFAGSDNSQSVHFSVNIFQSIAVLLYKLKNDADSVFDVNASIALCFIEEQNSRLLPIKCLIVSFHKYKVQVIMMVVLFVRFFT